MGQMSHHLKDYDKYEMPDLNPQPYKTELRDLTNGVYRIPQAKSYSKEHQTDLSRLNICYCINQQWDWTQVMTTLIVLSLM